MSRNVQYITDASGERTAVILPLDQYEELLEDLHIIRVAEETKDEPARPLIDVVEEMRQAGEIDV
jgi:hypothetical protein